jgi:ribosomal protein S18 acetylase RimI-like enzyme
MNIETISWQQTIPIRHKVLWPEKDPSFCKVENDENAIHYGAKVNGTIVCVASVYINAQEARLRKFGTLKEFQHKGIGSAMLKQMLADAAASNITYFWFDARESAIDFYRSFGFETEGSKFFKSEVAYFKMFKQL